MREAQYELEGILRPRAAGVSSQGPPEATKRDNYDKIRLTTNRQNAFKHVKHMFRLQQRNEKRCIPRLCPQQEFRLRHETAYCAVRNTPSSACCARRKCIQTRKLYQRSIQLNISRYPLSGIAARRGYLLISLGSSVGLTITGTAWEWKSKVVSNQSLPRVTSSTSLVIG